MVGIKYCGFTREDDVQEAVSLGVDFLGFVFAADPRRIDVDTARRLVCTSRSIGFRGETVGVFADSSIEMVMSTMKLCGLSIAQLHGNETAEYVANIAVAFPVWKALRIRHTDDEIVQDILDYESATAMLLDSYSKDCIGSSGSTFRHSLAIASSQMRKIVLAGGLTPENVEGAIRVVRPYAVDVCSGIELNPGIKCKRLMAHFVQSVRACK